MSRATASYGIRACSHCGEDYEARSSTSKTCSPTCAKERKRAWTAQHYELNRDKISERVAKWQRDNPERVRERSRRFEAAHRAERNSRPRDPVARAAQWRSWYAENRESVLARASERARGNPDIKRESQSRRRARARNAPQHRVMPSDLARERMRAQGLCSYCRVNPGEHWDHRVPLARGGAHSLGNLTLSCAPCNQQKHTKTVMEWRIWRTRMGLPDLRVL